MTLRVAAKYDPCRTVKVDLQKIKADLALVKARLFNPCWGLREIKREIKRIECAIFNGTFGLSEIKAEISQIISCVCDQAGAGSRLTTGPLLADNNEKVAHLKARNYTSATQTVTFSVFNLDTCTQAPTLAAVEVTPCCAAFTELAIPGNFNFEIQAQLSDPNALLVSAATRSGNVGAGGDVKQIYPAALWLPLTTFCTPSDID